MKLAHKLALVQAIAILALSLIAGLAIRHTVGQSLISAEKNQLTELNRLIVELTDSYREVLETSVGSHMRTLEDLARGQWTVNGTAPVGTKELPALYISGRLQNQQFDIVDRTTAMTGS